VPDSPFDEYLDLVEAARELGIHPQSLRRLIKQGRVPATLFAGKYLFKMHPGILLGACAGARTTTAALGAIQDEAKSKVPALGYTITYAVGNTLLIIWGIVIVLMMK